MNDYYLRFESEAAMRQAFGSVDEEIAGATATMHPLVAGMAVDIVGLIMEPTGETTMQDGLPVPVTRELPGWHVNLRGEALPEGLAQALVSPAKPRRVWA